MRKITDKQKEKLKVRKESRGAMIALFLEIWNERPHKSELSGVWLGKEPSSAFFHHILPKRNYPEAELDKDNIILLSLEEHDKVEMDPTYFIEINLRRQKLIEKWLK